MTPAPAPNPARRATAKPRQADTVERAYEQVKELAVRFQIRPGDRVKEAELAERLAISRTPLREALNRLVSEGFMSFVPNKGFFCRRVDTQEIFDLYETRAALESWAFKLACDRATDADIEGACALWERFQPTPGQSKPRQLAEADERFHLALARLSDNLQLVKMLKLVGDRIRFFREIDLENPERSSITFTEHAQIIEALRARAKQRGAGIIAEHVGMSAEHAVAVSKEGLARIYL